jgi:hypothetical protein
MASYYSVLQFVPNPIAGERVNIGVVALDDDGFVACRLVDDWRRVKMLGGDIAPVRDAAYELADTELSVAEVRDMADCWRNSLQLTEPRASTADPERLLEDMCSLMLVEVQTKQRDNSKSRALRQARRSLEAAFRGGTCVAGEILSIDSRTEMSGALARHEIDLAVRGDAVRVAAQGISFARPASRRVKKDIDATAWLLEDVRGLPDPPRMAVVVVPPPGGNRNDYQSAHHLFEELGAAVVTQNRVSGWAKQVAIGLGVREIEAPSDRPRELAAPRALGRG